MWRVNKTAEFEAWFKDEDKACQEHIVSLIDLLAEFGPALGRPYVDTIKESRYSKMKELRIQCKLHVYRIFLIFDPKRNAVLLIGGDKRGKKRFYKSMIALAERIYEKYLYELKKDSNDEKKTEKK